MSRDKLYELGTAVKITTILSEASPTSVSITIKDPANVTKVNAVAMTAATTTIYTYIYQSATTDVDGLYKIIIDAVYGAYTSRAITEFTMTDTDE